MRIWMVLVMASLLSATGVRLVHAQSATDAGTVVVSLVSRAASIESAPDAEGALLSLVNQIRRQHKLPPVMMDSPLRAAARAHSRDMAKQGFVGHGSVGGRSFADRIANYVGSGTFVGENVTLARTVEQAHSAFIASPGHLRNILEPKFRRVGIGIVNAGELGLFVTQDFAD